MKTTLVQLDASLDWRGIGIAGCLASAPRADLTVFPECYPFWREAGISHTTAMQRLEGVAGQLPGKTFMAGGYVADVGVDGARIRRNRVYLVHQGFVVDYYDKQCVFEREPLTPANLVKLFAWDVHRCLPLICADADQGPASAFMARLVQRATAAGAGPGVPIVVSSYGALLAQPYWTDSLHHLADACQAPVLICGIAGKSRSTFRYRVEDGGDGRLHPFGGGGSGLFLPGRRDAKQYAEPGYITVDSVSGRTAWTAFM